MKILITGSTGFVGSNILKKLDSNKYKISLIIRKETDIKKIEKFKLIYVDKSNFKEKIIKFNPDIVLHLASYLTSKDNFENLNKLLSSNIIFPCALLDALKETDIKYFINTGTFAEYFNNDQELDPAYLYSATKTAFRSILKYYSEIKNFKVINVIPYTIYGGKSRSKKVIDYILDSINSEKPINMTEGKQKLDFIHINDVANFYIHLINNLNLITEKYSEFRLGTGKSNSLIEISKIIEKITNKKIKINWGTVPYRKRDILAASADISNLKILNWKPKISIEEGIKKILEIKNE